MRDHKIGFRLLILSGFMGAGSPARREPGANGGQGVGRGEDAG
ncbi:MAG: hypothetical protein U1F35_15990 [Steroidobacteraceae bacterium]